MSRLILGLMISLALALALVRQHRRDSQDFDKNRNTVSSCKYLDIDDGDDGDDARSYLETGRG